MIRIKEAKRDIADNLWDELIVVGQVRSAVNAAVGAMAVWQVGLEGFGARHGDRGGRDGVGAEQEGPVSPGQLAGETVEHTGEGRGEASGEMRAHLWGTHTFLGRELNNVKIYYQWKVWGKIFFLKDRNSYFFFLARKH